MIQSMTSFARAENSIGTGQLLCELRSINHRYLEISLHLPEILRDMEMLIRERIRDQLKRGKIEATFRYQALHGENALFSINSTYAQALCQASEKIATFLRSPAAVSPIEIMRFPGVMEAQEESSEELKKGLLIVLDKALQDLIVVRAREGEELKQLFSQRLNAMEEELGKVRTNLPFILTEQRERLLKRFSDIKLELDPLRLEQEMVMFAQKMDVAEEVERAETHINEVRRVLDQGGAVGRRLDFLLQELNREANTLGSKSTDSTVTHAAVEMKVLIEQIREQVQNVE